MLHDLRQFIHNDLYTPTWNNLYTLGLNIIAALAQIHKEGLVHKDLHSGNILQRPDSVWVIADLGLCGPPDIASTQLYGCLAYLAPEILYAASSSLELPYTPEADIYSFGMLIYEAVTGVAPFRNFDKDSTKLGSDICSGVRPEIPASLPAHLASWIKRCWDARPQNRPTAAELSAYFVEQYQSSANEHILIQQDSTFRQDQSDDFIQLSQKHSFREKFPKPENLQYVY